jgi:hypothetical protein
VKAHVIKQAGDHLSGVGLLNALIAANGACYAYCFNVKAQPLPNYHIIYDAPTACITVGVQFAARRANRASTASPL